MPLVEGQMVGPYQIVKQLGQGGMATVYQAYHAKLDRYVAIKVMHPGFQDDANFHARFEREAQIVARLEHPHIVPVYDYAEYDGQPYLVMKFIEGRTLKNLLSAGPLTLEQILRIMTPVADALTYAHQQGVLHRDIKPSNILIDARGVPYLTDFGLARIAQAGESTMSQDVILGTPQYISPEQARGERHLDARTDTYSFGIVLYELVVGRPPFNADTPYAVVHDHIYREIPRPAEVNPDIPPAVEAVLLKALAKDPADRYASASELMTDFQRALSRSGLQALKPDRDVQAGAALDSLRLPHDRPAAGIPAPSAPLTPPKIVRTEASVDFGQIGRKISDSMRQGTGIAGQIVTAIQEAVDENRRPMTEEERIRKHIEKMYEERKELIIHLLIFTTMNLIFWGMWAGDWLPQLLQGANLQELAGLLDFPWPVFITGGWGVGMVAHLLDYNQKYGRGAQEREARIQAEIERKRQREAGADYDAKPKRDRRLRLTEDGELEEVVEDFDEKPKRRRR